MAALTTRRAFAYQKIVESLREGTFRAGDRLVESALCERLGLSRVPVREALCQLTSEGLIEHSPGLGATVKCPDRDELVDLYELRELLESHVVAQVAENRTEAELAELEECCQRMHTVLRDALDRGVWDQEERVAMFRADVDFHRVLSRIPRNSKITELIESFQLLWKMVVYDPRLPQASTWRTRSWAWGQHKRIVRAIRNKDSEAARKAMLHHLRAARRVALKAQEALWDLTMRGRSGQ